MPMKIRKNEEETALAVREPAPMAVRFMPVDFAQLKLWANDMSESQLVPKAYRGNPHDVAAAVMTGAEVGIPPMAALRNIYMIDGKPGFASVLTMGIVLQHPKCEYFRLVDSTDEVATYEAKRTGSKPVELSFTWKQAVKAGLTGKNNWKQYPAAMLRARCEVALARVVFPDRLAGLYTADELGADTDEDGRIVTATVERDAEPPKKKRAKAKKKEELPEIEMPKAKDEDEEITDAEIVEPEPEKAAAPAEPEEEDEAFSEEADAPVTEEMVANIGLACKENKIFQKHVTSWAKGRFEKRIPDLTMGEAETVLKFVVDGHGDSDLVFRVEACAKELKADIDMVDAYVYSQFARSIKHLTKEQTAEVIAWIVEEYSD
jgi:hypothetical protein